MAKYKRWQDWSSLVLAVWIAVSPAVLSFTRGVAVTALAGVVLAVIALVALANPEVKGAEVTQLLAWIFTFFVPWFLSLRGSGAVSLQIVAVVSGILSWTALGSIDARKGFYPSQNENHSHA